MTTLRLTDSAFGNLGLTIDEALDLTLISQQFSALLRGSYQFDSLDLSAVTRPGLSAQGLGLAGSEITVGDFALFDPELPLTGFSSVVLSTQTIAALGLSYDIRALNIFALSSENGLSYDSGVTTIDFSRTGTAALEVTVTDVAIFDLGDVPYGGFQIIGNAGDNIFYGNSSGSLDYYGSNAFFAGDGNDIILGGLGDELLEGGAGNDLLIGGEGDDLLLGHLQGDDSGSGDDVLFGGLGEDELVGGAGNDALFAGQDADTLAGGAGRDRFYVVENYDIGTGMTVFDPEQGEVPFVINTGSNISPSIQSRNTIIDFTAGEDTLVMAINDIQADIDGIFFIERVQAFEAPGGTELRFEHADGESFPVGFNLLDAQSALTYNDIVLQVTQSEAVVWQNLGLEIVDSQSGLFQGLSCEVRYTDASQSNGETGVDRFNFLRLVLPSEAEAGARAGQDKFDFTVLELDVSPAAIEDILFTTFEDFGEFTIEGYDSGNLPIEDFFFDAQAQANRAVHVEFMSDYGSGNNAIAVYVDADGNGDFDGASDLSFVVTGLQDANGNFYDNDNPLTASDLYNDVGDGSGTGIFIFNEEQYDLWFNDAPPDSLP